MQFLTPLAFALAALLPIIVALYFLKLRREERSVSSIYLWRELVRDTAANAPWQRLRPSWLLFLQLLFLVILIAALVRPFTWTAAAAGDHLILVMDLSASMGARDGVPDRLGSARGQAQELAEKLPADTPVTLIAAGDSTQVLLSGSRDRYRLNQALDGLRVGMGNADMATALELASAVAAGEGQAEIAVLSDGGVQLPQRLNSTAAIRYWKVGSSDENQSIATLTLNPAAAGQGLSAFVRVSNYGTAEVQRRLVVTAYAANADGSIAQEGTLAGVRDLTLPGKNAVGVTISDLPIETVAVEAYLEGEDLLASDDRAWAVAPVHAGAQIQIVGPGNRFLETALSLLPDAEVTTISLADYEALWEKPEGEAAAGEQTADWLTVFDGVLPEAGHYPPGALFFLGPLRSTEFFSVTGELKEPAARPASASEPLLSYVDLRDLAVARAAQLRLPDWGRPVIVADGTDGTESLLVVGERDGRRLAVLAFDPRQSDLPLRVAFPLLLANLVDFLAPGSRGTLPEQVAAGEPVELVLPVPAGSVQVIGPAGAGEELPVEQGKALFSGAQRLGLYRVSWKPSEGNGGPYLLGRFAVNGFSAQEAEIRPQATLAIGGENGGGVAADRPVRQEWWEPLAWVALGLLVAEWLVQYRGALARLWGRLRFGRAVKAG